MEDLSELCYEKGKEREGMDVGAEFQGGGS